MANKQWLCENSGVGVKDISEIRKIVSDMGARIGAPSKLLNISSTAVGDCSNHIEIIDDEYCYVITERGKDIQREKTKDLDELLYWIFDNVVMSMAMDIEKKQRQPNNDPRRILFSNKLKLLGKLSAKWEKGKSTQLRRHCD